MTMIKAPTATKLALEYGKFKKKDPCTRGTVKHDCTVRMTIALSRSIGTDILKNFPHKPVHGKNCCRLDTNGREGQYRHYTGPSKFKEYLHSLPSTSGFKFIKVAVDKKNKVIPEKLKARGIIYLKDCFWNYEHNTSGSHMDYWNGKRYTSNSERGTGLSFRDRTAVYFCKLVG